MYAVTVRFTLHADQAAGFLPLVSENAKTSLREEDGCQQFDVCRNPDDPTTIFLYELYLDRRAFDAHLDSDHFRAFDAAVRDRIVDKHVATYTEVHQ